MWNMTGTCSWQVLWEPSLSGFVKPSLRDIMWSFWTLVHTLWLDLDAFHLFQSCWTDGQEIIYGRLKYKTRLWWYRYERVHGDSFEMFVRKWKRRRERVRVTESKREGKVGGSAEPDTNEPPFWWDLTAQKKAESLDTDATQHSLLIGAVCMCAWCVQGNLGRNKIRFVRNMLITMIIHSWVWLGPRLICRRTTMRLRLTLFATPELSFFLSFTLSLLYLHAFEEIVVEGLLI